MIATHVPLITLGCFLNCLDLSLLPLHLSLFLPSIPFLFLYLYLYILQQEKKTTRGGRSTKVVEVLFNLLRFNKVSNFIHPTWTHPTFHITLSFVIRCCLSSKN